VPYKAEERAVLAALAVWEDGSDEMLHYETAPIERNHAKHDSKSVAKIHDTNEISTKVVSQ